VAAAIKIDPFPLKRPQRAVSFNRRLGRGSRDLSAEAIVTLNHAVKT